MFGEMLGNVSEKAAALTLVALVIIVPLAIVIGGPTPFILCAVLAAAVTVFYIGPKVLEWVRNKIGGTEYTSNDARRAVQRGERTTEDILNSGNEPLGSGLWSAMSEIEVVQVNKREDLGKHL
jgi:hypothetical protein